MPVHHLTFSEFSNLFSKLAAIIISPSAKYFEGSVQLQAIQV